MTVTITATPQPSGAPPGIKLDIVTDQTEVVLWRVGQDGSRALVRSYDGGALPVAGASAILTDYEAPFGKPVRYTADGSDVTDSATVTLNVEDVWLIHPGVPILSQPVTVLELGDRDRPVSQSVRYPIGRKFPISTTDGRRKAATYQMVLRTHTLPEKDALDRLLDDAAPLLFQVPASFRWGVVSEYVAIGPVPERRYPNMPGDFQRRRWTLPCTVVARPAGGSQAAVTYGYSQGLYPTYGERFAAHATYGEALNP